MRAFCRAPHRTARRQSRFHTPVSAFWSGDACAPAVAADLHSRGTGAQTAKRQPLRRGHPARVRAEDAVGVEAVAVEEGFGDGGKISYERLPLSQFLQNTDDGIGKMRNIQYFYHTLSEMCYTEYDTDALLSEKCSAVTFFEKQERYRQWLGMTMRYSITSILLGLCGCAHENDGQPVPGAFKKAG